MTIRNWGNKRLYCVCLALWLSFFGLTMISQDRIQGQSGSLFCSLLFLSFCSLGEVSDSGYCCVGEETPVPWAGWQREESQQQLILSCCMDKVARVNSALFRSGIDMTHLFSSAVDINLFIVFTVSKACSVYGAEVASPGWQSKFALLSGDGLFQVFV